MLSSESLTVLWTPPSLQAGFPSAVPPPKMTKCNRTATKPASHPEEGPQSHALAHTRGRMRTKQSLSPRVSLSSEHCVSDLA